MAENLLPELGKIHPEFFDQVIFPRLGKKDDSVLIGPRHGIDYGVVKLKDTCLAFSTDPFFIVPAYGFTRAAWFAFHIIVSDVAVSGLKPRYLIVDLNLPPEITEAQLTEMWQTVHNEAEMHGLSIITGHTARYTGCNYPMVGGATAIAAGPESELRGPHLVRPGDKIVITKGPAIETVGLLAISFPEKFKAAFGTKFQQDAENVFYQMSVLEDCKVAREFPGVRVMHDATECGIWGGLYEMARAGNYGFKVEKGKIVTQEVVLRTCDHFGIDPYVSISEGTLITMVDPLAADSLVRSFTDHGIISSIVGEVTKSEDGLLVDGKELQHPKVDPYWIVMDRLSREV